MDMKKIVGCCVAASLCVAFVGSVNAKSKRRAVKRSAATKIASAQSVGSVLGETKSVPLIASVDMLKLMRESKEGKKLEAEVREEVGQFESFVRKSGADFMAEREALSKQASVLSKEAFAEKQAKLARNQKDLQHQIESRREELTGSIQRQQLKLRDTQLTLARNVQKEKGWSLLVEKNAPGLLGVADSTDKTSDLITVVNADFDNRIKSVESVVDETDSAAAEGAAAVNV